MELAIMETAITAKPKPLPEKTPAPEPTPAGFSPRAEILACAGSAMASSILLWLCFHPVAWGFLGWIALAPFLALVRSQARPRVIYGCAFFGGVGFFLPILQWMSVADRTMNLAWVLLSIYCALYLVAALYCVRCLERWRIPLVVSFPLTWIALEYLRSFCLTGFAWYYLAHTQHDYLPMIQITDLGGVYIVSLLVAAVNAFVFDFIYQFRGFRRWFNQTELEPIQMFASVDLLNNSFFADCRFRRNLVLEAMIMCVMLVATYGYGIYRLGQNQFYQGPTVCLLQTHLAQELRERKTTPEEVGKQLKDLCVRAALDPSIRPDLVIWPETSFPKPWVQVSPKIAPMDVPPQWTNAEADTRAEISKFTGKLTRVPHLFGMNAHYLDENLRHLRYNSAILVKPVVRRDGQVEGQVEGKFDKIHRVPFGEFVPFKDWLPFLAWLTPYDYDFSIQKGDKFTRFATDKHHFGVLICYEDTDPFLARRYLEESEEGPPVDFLVNISNDGWFAGSVEHEEHLAVSRFRAIECRRAMVRAVNMGISAVIDPNGRVLKPRTTMGTEPPEWLVTPIGKDFAELPTSEWHHFKETAGVLKAIVPIDRRASFYVRAGDWLPIACWVVLLVGASVAWLRRRFAMPPKPLAV